MGFLIQTIELTQEVMLWNPLIVPSVDNLKHVSDLCRQANPIVFAVFAFIGKGFVRGYICRFNPEIRILAKMVGRADRCAIYFFCIQAFAVCSTFTLINIFEPEGDGKMTELGAEIDRSADRR